MKIQESLLTSKKFQLGFEVEMIYSNKRITQEQLKKELRQIHPNIIAGSDDSIRPDGRLNKEDKPKKERYWDSWYGEWRYTDSYGSCEHAMEIKTPPLLPKQSLEVLEKVFALVNKYGYTNSSCGFHLNFSPIPERLYQALDPFAFTTDSLWSRIKKDFGRANSQWCRKVWVKNSRIDLSKLALFGYLMGRNLPGTRPNVGKSADVNFNHYWGSKTSRRIEIRAFGGEGYHKKFDLIKKYADDILKTFLKNCEA
jgi:hypothetical protein